MRSDLSAGVNTMKMGGRPVQRSPCALPHQPICVTLRPQWGYICTIKLRTYGKQLWLDFNYSVLWYIYKIYKCPSVCLSLFVAPYPSIQSTVHIYGLYGFSCLLMVHNDVWVKVFKTFRLSICDAENTSYIHPSTCHPEFLQRRI